MANSAIFCTLFGYTGKQHPIKTKNSATALHRSGIQKFMD